LLREAANTRAEVEFFVVDIDLAVCHLPSAMTGNELLRKLKRFAR
jgi:hypothetical protein